MGCRPHWTAAPKIAGAQLITLTSPKEQLFLTTEHLLLQLPVRRAQLSPGHRRGINSGRARPRLSANCLQERITTNVRRACSICVARLRLLP